MSSSVPEESYPVEVHDVRFRGQKRLALSETSGFSDGHSSALAACSKYGLLFAAAGSSVLALRVADIEGLQDHASVSATSSLCAAVIRLARAVTHIAVSCDDLTLLVVTTHQQQCAHAYLYDVRALTSAAVPYAELRLSATPSDSVRALAWNPALADTLAMVMGSGALAVYRVPGDGGEVNVSRLPGDAAAAICVCWSRKGKQLVVGRRDGWLVQYRPDLSEARRIPPAAAALPVCVSVLWLNTYEFLCGYRTSPSSGMPPELTLLHLVAPKQDAVKYVSFMDACFSSGESRPPVYAFHFLAEWSLSLVASSQALELAVVGCGADSSAAAAWKHWVLDGDARAELPLGASQQESYPVGLAVSYCSQRPVLWGETQQLPPAPTVHLLSDTGQLCSFTLINLKQGIPQVTAPPQPLTGVDVSTVRRAKFPITMEQPAPTSAAPPPTAPSGVPTPVPATGGFSFGASSTASVAPLRHPMTAGFAALSSSSPNTMLQPLPTSLESTSTLPKPEPAAVRHPCVDTSTIAPPSTVVLEAPPEVLSSAITGGIGDVDCSAALTEALDEETTLLRQELAEALRPLPLIAETMEPGYLADMSGRVAGLVSFSGEMRDTVAHLSQEIGQLSAESLQTLASFEEARTLHLRAQDSRFQHLLRMRPLSSGAAQRVSRVREARQYLESQLAAAGQVLDEQWCQFLVDSKQQRLGAGKQRKQQLQQPHGPGLNAVYRILANNCATCVRLRTTLNALTERLDDVMPAARVGGASSADRSWIDEVSRLGEALASADLTLKTPGPGGKISRALTAPTLACPSPARQQKLRDGLARRLVTPVRRAPISVDASVSSSILLQAGSSPYLQKRSGTSSLSATKPSSLAATQSIVSIPSAPRLPRSMTSTPVPSKGNRSSNDTAAPPTRSVPLGVDVAKSILKTKGDLAAKMGGEFSGSAFAAASKTVGFSAGPPSYSTAAHSSSVSTVKVERASPGSAEISNFKPTAVLPATSANVSTSSGTSFGKASAFSDGFSFRTAFSAAISEDKSSLVTSAFSPTSNVKTVTLTPTSSGLSAEKEAALASLSSASSPSRVVLGGITITAIPTVSTPTSGQSKGTETVAVPADAGSEPLSKSASGGLFGHLASSAVPRKNLFQISPAASGSGSIFGGGSTSSSGAGVLSSSDPLKTSIFAPSSSTSVSGEGLLTPTTATPSNVMFGKSLQTSSGSVFGGVAASPTSSTLPSPAFGAVASPVIVTPATVSTTLSNLLKAPPSSISSAGEISSSSSQSQVKGVFGGSLSTTSSSGTVFGVAIPPHDQPKPGSIFGGATPASSSSSGGLFSAPTASQGTSKNSVSFGSSVVTTSSGTTSLVGASLSSPDQIKAGSVFGGGTSTASPFGSGSSVFGNEPSTGSYQVQVPDPTKSEVASIFSSDATTIKTGSIFGSPAVKSEIGSIFGSTAVKTETGSMFGSAVAQVTTGGSVFGSTTPQNPSTVGSIFGGASSQDSDKAGSGSIFGSPAVSQAGTGMFGSVSQAGTSIFGSPAVSQAGSSVFGSPAVSQAGTSVFGSPAVSQAGTGVSSSQAGTGVFGGPSFTSPSSTSSGGLFGKPPAAGGSTSVFGAAGQTGSVFGGGTSSFGSGVAVSSSASSTVSATPSFGGFGLGGAASPDRANTNVFGSSTTFGQSPSSGLFSSSSGASTTQQQSATSPSASVFGASATFGGAPVFGGISPSNAFGGSSPSGSFGGAPAFGGGSVFGGSSIGTAASGGGFASAQAMPTFGSLAQNSQQPTFGSAAQQPAFGGAVQQPGFGGAAQQPAFGSAAQQPAFGSAAQQPAFGSSGQQPAFGGTAQQQAFGGAAQQPAFGGAAQQPGFGGATQQPAFGSAPPSSPPQFGGSSFSSWR